MIRATGLALLIGGSVSSSANAAALTSEELLDIFQARCSALAADPEGAIEAGAAGNSAGYGTVTDDKAVLFYSEEVKLPGETFGELSFLRNQVPSGTATTCMINVSAVFALDPPPPIVPDLENVITSRAEALLSAPATTHGGETKLFGSRGRLVLWAAGDSPSGSLISLNQSDFQLVLTMELVTDAAN